MSINQQHSSQESPGHRICDRSRPYEIGSSKIPEVTLTFWVIKIPATTLGETGGDAVSMSLNLGYVVASIIFIGIFAAVVAAQVAAKSFQPLLYWAVIVATTTLGTTLAD